MEFYPVVDLQHVYPCKMGFKDDSGLIFFIDKRTFFVLIYHSVLMIENLMKCPNCFFQTWIVFFQVCLIYIQMEA